MSSVQAIQECMVESQTRKRLERKRDSRAEKNRATHRSLAPDKKKLTNTAEAQVRRNRDAAEARRDAAETETQQKHSRDAALTQQRRKEQQRRTTDASETQ